MHLFVQLQAAFLDLTTTLHVSFFEFKGLFVEVLTLFLAAALLLGFPILHVAILLGTFPLTPILLTLVIQGPELGVELLHLSVEPAFDRPTLLIQRAKRLVHLFLKANAAFLELVSARELSFFEFEGLFIEVLTFFLAAALLLGLPLLSVALHLRATSVDPIALSSIIKRLELSFQLLRSGLVTLFDRLTLSLVLVSRHLSLVQCLKSLMRLFLQAHAAFLELVSACHLSSLELIRCLVEMLTLVSASPVLFLFPLSVATIRSLCHHIDRCGNLRQTETEPGQQHHLSDHFQPPLL